ncbi:MAG: response regulator [Proteobacteria bacterium]|nr:response regulator [Pseudomonadota bacterium]MBU1686160.1 response regulator [Pseudomonadota bacterium]
MKQKSKVLIVDDRVENLVALERILGDLDIQLIRATSGNEALALTLEHEFALALVDVQMPEMDGYEMVTLLRQEPATEHLPVIFVSAVYSGDYYKIKGIEAGAVDFIEKPLKPAMLIGKVRVFLDLYRQREKLQQFSNELERMVEERTASLEVANEKLKNEIKEREELETRIRHIHKMEAIGTMAGGIAHDFNNILAIIQGNAQIAVKKMANTEPIDEEIQDILKAASRAKDLVGKILTFSRISQNSKAVIHLQAVVEDSVAMLRSTLPTSVVFKSKICAGCRPVRIEPMEVNQIIMNLFVNATQAMDEKGTITLGLEEVSLPTPDSKGCDVEPGVYICLSVADTGCGMDTKTMEAAFDPFYTTKPIGQGTGMGLSVVHGIVRGCGGTITIDSEVGRGTTFRLYFPVVDAEPTVPAGGPVPSSPEVQEPETDGDGARVLFVDDETSLTLMARKILEREGYRVMTFNHSPEALAVFEKTPEEFDLVITDQSMPELSGVEMAEKMLSVRADIPIVLSTGFSTKVSEENFREKGFCGILAKPYNTSELIQVVAAGLAIRRNDTLNG